jgi:hypothetical protein
MSEDSQRVPEPGREAAPDSTSQGMDPAVAPNPGDAMVTTHGQSRVGPGAGENEVVKVTAPVQDEDDEVTSHPTLRQGSTEGPSTDHE